MTISFVYGCLVAFIAVIIVKIYKYTKNKKARTIPGPSPSDDISQGNFPEISACGSFYEFLRDVHGKYGDIVSFWWGKLMCVSIASPSLFVEQAKVFDRPPELYELFAPLLGEQSITYVNGSEGKSRLCAYQQCFSYDAIVGYYPILHHLSKKLCVDLDKYPSDDHIPLLQKMNGFALEAIFDAALNKCFKNKEDVLSFKHNYDTVWWYMEDTLKGNVHDADAVKQYEKSQREIQSIFQKVTEEILSSGTTYGQDHHKLIDTMVNMGMSKEKTKCDLLTIVIAGFHTSALLLSWGMYYLAKYPDIQEKVYRELNDVLGEEEVTRDISGELVYLRQIIDEVLRCSNLAPYATRVQDTETQLGGYTLPAGTPVVQCLGVVHASEKLWDQPEKFDPDRFSPRQRKSMLHHAFEPFGFAGGRKCMGYQFAIHEATIVFSYIFRKYKVCLVPGQTIERMHGLITKPKDEIWVTLEKRGTAT